MKRAHAVLDTCCLCRRRFLQAFGAATGTYALLPGTALAAEGPAPAENGAPAQGQTAVPAPAHPVPTVCGAFLYPPSESLRQAGYWSWPGSTFDAEGHQKSYSDQLAAMAQKLNMQISMDAAPLDSETDVARFVDQVKQSRPDGLLLIPLKKGHWPHVTRIIDQTQLPTVVLATLGVLLVDHIAPIKDRAGVYLINAMDDLAAVEQGMRMIRTGRVLRDAVIVNLAGSEAAETRVPHLGTCVRQVPLSRFYDEYQNTKITAPVEQLAHEYAAKAQEIVEPQQADIRNAARTYHALKHIAQAEGAQAMMMDCLPGLGRPHKHVPPCMGFMSLRDEGFPIGCQSDLSATLTLLLVQQLFDKPGFQQNAPMDTEQNLYFGAHCTSPSKMNGPAAEAAPYILRSHAEAGWGCVPQVLFAEGQEITLAQYVPEPKPQMHVYTGKVVRCYPKAPGGCRTNVVLSIDDVPDVCHVKGMHQVVFYGRHGRQLRTFCQLHGIEVTS